MQAFIFDFDGVIVDSERHWRPMQELSIREILPNWKEGEADQFMGHGQRAIYDILVEQYGLTLTYSEYQEHSQQHIDHIYDDLAQPLPGLHDLLNRIDSLSVSIAIASSANKQWIHKALTRLNLDDRFPIICDSSDVDDKTKPLPDVYFLAAKRLGVEPAECVVIEDSFHGVTAAKAAGMYCFGLRTDMNPDQDLSKADQIIHHFDELTGEVLRGV